MRHIITSAIEHHAIELTAHEVGKLGSAEVHWVKLDAHGRPDMADAEHLLSKHKNALVSVMHANNELGTRIDLNAIGSLCRKHGALFHSDTVQTMAHYRFDRSNRPSTSSVPVRTSSMGPRASASCTCATAQH